MKDEDLKMILRDAAVPEPPGGMEAARERAMGQVRHHFPTNVSRPRTLWRPLGATALAGAVAVVLFLAWPEPRAEADPLPTEAQMQQLYDQHETHHNEHFHNAAQQEKQP